MTATATPVASNAAPTTLRTTVGTGSTPTAGNTLTNQPVNTTAPADTVAATTATPAGGTATVAAVTTTRPATTPTAASTPIGPVQMTTWSDPNGFLKVQYPSNWTQARDETDATNLVNFDGPNGPFVDLFIVDPQKDTIAEEVGIVIKNQAKDTQFIYTSNKTADVTVGGELAKLLTYTYTDKQDNGRSFNGAWWIVNRNGKQVGIRVGAIGQFGADVDATSVPFPSAAARK